MFESCYLHLVLQVYLKYFFYVCQYDLIFTGFPAPYSFVNTVQLTLNNVISFGFCLTTELAGGPVGQIICLEKEVVVLEKNQLLLSSLLSCFFSWGFPDNSCAFGNYATGKVCMQEYKAVERFCLLFIVMHNQAHLYKPNLKKIQRNVTCVNLKLMAHYDGETNVSDPFS